MSKIGSLLFRSAGLLLALTTAAAAQTYPSKTVRIVVPFPPGAINDTIGRLIATQLTTRLGKQVIVDNRPGAGGIIAYEAVAHAPKDGHTLLIVSSAMTISPWLRKLPYDTVKSFAPVAIIAGAPNVIGARTDLPAKSAKELIALAKKQKLKYASSGVGTFLHLGGELFKLSAGVDILHIPFKGAGPAMIDVMGGRTDLVFASVASTITHVRSGKLKAIGVGATQRNPLMPDVPTVSESGLPGYTAANWFGVAAPAGTPAPIIARLHKELTAIQDSPEMKKQLSVIGADIMKMSSAEFAKHISSELAKWGRVVKDAGIKPQ
jgi:tripartite-type tricarboxylate transporter receptor subunit TctC